MQDKWKNRWPELKQEDRKEAYPVQVGSRIELESTIYDKWYSKKENENKPFYYHNQKYEKAFVKALLHRYGIQKGSSLIDIGCGNGLYSNLFYAHGLKVTAVDLSENAITYCSKKYGTGIDWKCSDVFSLAYENSFDYGFCSFFTFFNIFDTPEQGTKYVDSIMRYLRHHGILFFTWISDLSAIRLPDHRFNIMNFTLQQMNGFFSNYRVESYTLDSRAITSYCMGKYSLNKYITRLSCALVQLAASSWKRVRIVSVATK